VKEVEKDLNFAKSVTIQAKEDHQKTKENIDSLKKEISESDRIKGRIQTANLLELKKKEFEIQEKENEGDNQDVTKMNTEIAVRENVSFTPHSQKLLKKMNDELNKKQIE
jgi:hypothetical protein